tara:strand:+ start:3507 stop:3803 length:297 start_codon:yes stop_codon:yes gene_type:complete
MARKIRLTEKNLQQIVSRVIKESQLLNENLIDVDCDCGNDCICGGTYDGDAMHCECCATECKDESVDDGKFGTGGRPMAMDRMRMRESYNRLRRNRRR